MDGCGTMIYEVEDVDEEDEGECDAKCHEEEQDELFYCV